MKHSVSSVKLFHVCLIIPFVDSQLVHKLSDSIIKFTLRFKRIKISKHLHSYEFLTSSSSPPFLSFSSSSLLS